MSERSEFLRRYKINYPVVYGVFLPMPSKQDKRTIFFSNPKVSSDQLIAPHYARTKARILETPAKYILAIQDQMRLNYTTHLAKTELGRIGLTGKTEQYGFIQHSLLCVTDENENLGLMDVRLFDYDEFDTQEHHHHRALKDKASRCWVDALERMRERLGDIHKPIITVTDREGDFYEFLHPFLQEKELFVIRAKHNRYTGERHRSRGIKLWDLLKGENTCGSLKVSIQDVNTRELRELVLELKAIAVTFPSPHKSVEEQKGKENFQPISLKVVQAYNEEHEWVLLTNLPIDTAEQVQDIVNIYRQRWHIEDYHKVLKTGYQVDEIYLHSSKEAIKNLIIMASISACRLYWLIYTGRAEVDLRADQLFESFEWKAIYVYFKEKIPKECPRLSSVILKIAQLGGYKPSKQAKPPGIKTLWIGYQQFTAIAQMYRNMSKET